MLNYKNAKFAENRRIMISIVICSASKDMLANAIKNIENTIGVPYEVISFDNPDGKDGICRLYNEGARKAKFDIVCFMHEDLDIKTKNWGGIVLDTFSGNHKLGVLGIVGCAYKSAAPTAWEAISFEAELIHCNYIQSFKYAKHDPMTFFKNPTGKDIANVVSVDGMWFCTTKAITQKYQFDETLLTGFHCYDLDFCFQVGQEYDISVTFKVLMEHLSEGNFKRDWWTDTLKLHRKWQHKLPLWVDDLPNRTKFLIEKRSYRWIIERLIEMKFSWAYIIKFLINQKRRGVMDWQQYFKGNLFTLKYILGIKKYPF